MTLAIIFDSVGVGEWFVLLAVLLIVVGPRRLPSTARKFGQYYSKFRRAADGFKRQLMEMDTEIDTAVAKVEREASDATDGVIESAEAEDYSSGPDEYEDFGEMGDDSSESADASEAAASSPARESAAAPVQPAVAQPARDLSSVKISVSPAPTGAANDGN